jgi:predicted MFS family arabinose efflux permease
VLALSLPCCGLAPTIGVLLAARTVGGMSWAGCGPAGFAIMAEGVAVAKRGLVSSWQMTSGTLGGSIGTAAGGLVISSVGWRAVFLLAMGPVWAIWLLSWPVLPRDAAMTAAELRARLAKFDKLGTLLFIVCCGSALMAINRGNDLGWRSGAVLGLAAVAALTLPLLVAAERRAAQPILPVHLFLADPVALKCILLYAGTMTAFNGSFVILPIFLQLARGWTPAEVALCLGVDGRVILTTPCIFH